MSRALSQKNMFYFVVVSAKCLMKLYLSSLYHRSKKGALLCLLNVVLDENKIVPSIYSFEFFFSFKKELTKIK